MDASRMRLLTATGIYQLILCVSTHEIHSERTSQSPLIFYM